MAVSETQLRPCPGEVDLLAYHAGELGAEAAAEIRAHLPECAACAAVAAELLAEHEAWVQRLRSAGRPPEGGLPRAAPLAADAIAGYEILEELNRGGQGIVYRALQLSTRREVAVKVLREGPYAAPAVRRRFEREVEVVAGLRHPDIVTIFDSGVTADGRQYVVMDYVRGQRLDRYVRSARPDCAAVLRLFSRICHAVNYAHQRSVIHRDLKPGNVLVDESGAPHILDFGLARHAPQPGATTCTLTGEVAGTVPYMSPEQARGLPDATDVRGDVYSLGVMLYELLSGSFPYPVSGETLGVLRHVAETPPARLRGRTGIGGAAIDDELETIVLQALAKERERRYQTAGDLGRDVERYLAGEPIAAKRDSALYLLRKTLRRYRLAAAVTAGVVLVVTISAAALAVMYAGQVRLRAEAERQSRLAVAAEAAAQARFAQVRELARFFAIEFDPLIARLPGAAPARRVLVEKSLAYLDGLAAEASDTPDLQHELAAAYLAIGDVQGDLNAANLGDLRAALASYEKGARILDELAQDGVVTPAAHRTRQLARLKLGDALRALGDADGAMGQYREVLELGATWLREHAEDAPERSNVANAHGRLGGLLADRGETEAALGHFEESMRQARERAAAQPDDLWAQRSVGVALTELAGIRHARGDRAGAIENYREFLDISERLRAAHPEDLVVRRDVAIAHQWIGILLAEEGQAAAALESYAASCEVLEDLLRDDPLNTAAEVELVTNESKMGELHLAAGRVAEAATLFTRSAERIEGVAERQPDRPDVLRLLGVAHYKLSELAAQRARDEGLERGEQEERQRAACAWLERCHGVFVDMRARGILGAADAGVPEEIAQELADCRARLPESELENTRDGRHGLPEGASDGGE
jgi:tetratricopeptide (TPR) repeat protein